MVGSQRTRLTREREQHRLASSWLNPRPRDVAAGPQFQTRVWRPSTRIYSPFRPSRPCPVLGSSPDHGLLESGGSHMSYWTGVGEGAVGVGREAGLVAPATRPCRPPHPPQGCVGSQHGRGGAEWGSGWSWEGRPALPAPSRGRPSATVCESEGV